MEPAAYCVCADPENCTEVPAQRVKCRRFDARFMELRAENERLRTLTERLRMEAESHAMEARTANTIIAEIYQAVTGATGEPGNWNGARPVVDHLERLRGLLEEAECVKEIEHQKYDLGTEDSWQFEPRTDCQWCAERREVLKDE